MKRTSDLHNDYSAPATYTLGCWNTRFIYVFSRYLGSKIKLIKRLYYNYNALLIFSRALARLILSKMFSLDSQKCCHCGAVAQLAMVAPPYEWNAQTGGVRPPVFLSPWPN